MTEGAHEPRSRIGQVQGRETGLNSLFIVVLYSILVDLNNLGMKTLIIWECELKNIIGVKERIDQRNHVVDECETAPSLKVTLG